MDNSGLNASMPSVTPSGDSREARTPDLLSLGDLDKVKAFLSGQRSSAIGKSSDQPVSTREERLDKIERILDEHTKRNSANELRAWQDYLEWQEKLSTTG